MLAIIRQIFLKGGTIADAIAYVVKQTGNMPSKAEGLQMIKMFKDIEKNTAKVIDFPTDRITPFYKPRPGDIKEQAQDFQTFGKEVIDELNAPIKPDLEVVKDKTLFKDSPKAIAKIKAENKAAAKRLKEKKKAVEDFSDDGDFDPGGMASGGLAKILDL